MMKVTLCREGSCCPAVEIKDDDISIGEEGNIVHLKRHEWNELVAKIKSSELHEI